MTADSSSRRATAGRRQGTSLPSAFIRYRPAIEAELRAVVDLAPAATRRMIAYHMGWVDQKGADRGGTLGKLVRPTLCLAACQAAGGDPKTALPAAAALELIHNFSLIHDDIEDASAERHHQSTLWKIWGEAQAINAGDTVMALTQLALLRLERNRIGYERIVRAVGMLARACMELCEGQQMDIAYEARIDIGLEQYLAMIARKTAALLATAVSLGALAGSRDERLQAQLYTVGIEMGLAYQIRDDILGTWGLRETMGKPVGGDIEKRKKTLPVVFALGKASGRTKQELLRLFRQGSISHDEVGRVVAILDELGSREYAQAAVEDHYRRALAALDAAGLPAQQCGDLLDLAEFFVKRDY